MSLRLFFQNYYFLFLIALLNEQLNVSYLFLSIDELKSASSSSSSSVNADIGSAFSGASSSGSALAFDDYEYSWQEKSIWRKLNECKSDYNCVHLHSICLNGNCVRVCNRDSLVVDGVGPSIVNNINTNDVEDESGPNKSSDSKCVHFHCDSKKIIRSNYTIKNRTTNGFSEFSIETNNYPLLNRYLSRKKCAWLLDNLNEPDLDVKNAHDTIVVNSQNSAKRNGNFIQLKFERFSTQLANDYLYIFAGDSVFSPLLAALSGNQLAGNEPSKEADREFADNRQSVGAENVLEYGDDLTREEEVEEDELDSYGIKYTPINITFYNVTKLFLLFKTDVTSSYSILNNFKSSRFNNKPTGISIKYRFSSRCSTKNQTLSNSTDICFDDVYLDNPTNGANSKCPNKTGCENENKEQIKFVETLNYVDEENREPEESFNSTLRRAFHCSFEYKRYLYVIGGYSFSNAISFVSRVNLTDLKWEHSIDRKPSTIVNRSNRRFFSDVNFKQPKIDLPQARYAHSCVLDVENDHVYMFGGIKYDNENMTQNSRKWTTNELWSYNLLTNKWTLLAPMSSSNASIGDDQQAGKEFLLPIGVSGHTMHLVQRGAYDKSILIFFGYSEYYASNVNLIQEFILSSKIWYMHNTFNINIGYAHSSTYDKKTHNVYFYGGLVIKSDYGKTIFDYTDQFSDSSLLNSKFAQSISSSFYSFDIQTFEWKKLNKSFQSSYMHSATMFDSDKILFFGGICDSNFYSHLSAAFISSHLRLFSIKDNDWKKLRPLTSLNTFSAAYERKNFYRNSIKLNRRQRYAHTALLFDNSLYVFGGFNGFFLSDLFKIDLEKLTVNGDWQFRRKRSDDDEPNRQLKLNYFEYVFNRSNLNADSLGKREPIKTPVNVNPNEQCRKYSNCQNCHLDPSCVWSRGSCESYAMVRATNDTTRPFYKKPTCAQLCAEHRSCQNCTSLTNVNGQYQSECVWCASQSKCLLKKAVHVHFPFGDCLYMISDRNQCAGGEPDKWRALQFTQSGTLKVQPSNDSQCSTLYSNCSSCIRDERCGWCTNDTDESGDYTFNTGYGRCVEGGETSPINGECSAHWFYSKCPNCQCNGHATCSTYLNITNQQTNITEKVALPYYSLTCGSCSNNTEGDYCSNCRRGYFGDAENNGQCAPCDCGSQASICDPKKGNCYCNTKGVIGVRCDQCDSPRYSGKPNLTDGTCYYNLTTDYQFTFNLNKDSDRFYTKINFVNHIGHGVDDDIDFMIRCFREVAYINVTYVSHYSNFDSDTADSLFANADAEWPFDIIENLSYLWNNLNANDSYFSKTKAASFKSYVKSQIKSSASTNNYYFGPLATQTPLLSRVNCTTSELKYTFSNRDLNYSDKSRNFIFIVYVYDFQTPITIQVAFSRRTRVQLLHFFITFFGCLLSLLTIAFITWKTKQRYDRYRRQRQIVLQMEHMASRPFTRLFIDADNEHKQKEAPLDQKTMMIKLTRNESGKVHGKKVASAMRLRSPNVLKLAFNKQQPLHADDGQLESDLIEDRPRVVTPVMVEKTSQKFKIMPIAVEPLSNNKTAIVTCMLKLPQGGLQCTPKGSSPFVLCSTYVQLASHSPLVNFFNSTDDRPDDITTLTHSEQQKRTDTQQIDI